LIDAPVLVTRGRAFRIPDGVPAGTVYRAISHLQVRDPSRLSGTTGEYPDDVKRFTKLPESTPDRIERFTANLTRRADGPYETARVVELWLERTKTYSLNASHDPSEPVAEQFVFEMERGYCEYFATSMVVMLRSQDIPARYVVGYAPGERVGEDTYEVRAMDAHAWVEVYFADVGWVRFDPTPAAPRRASERRAQSPDEIDPRPIVPGSPGENGTEIRPTPGEWLLSPPYQVRLNATPVPGDRVTATVTKDGKPTEGVVVTFDGEPVGATDRNGNVTAVVPYVENLTVGARRPRSDESENGDDDGGEDDTRADLVGSLRSGSSSGSGFPADARWRFRSRSFDFPRGRPVGSGSNSPDRTTGGHLAAVGGVGGGASVGSLGEKADEGNGNENGGNRTYDVKTDVSITTDGTFAPGRSASVVATIGDVPVRNASVTVDGRTVGRTDDRGRVRVDLPESARGSVAVAIERGEVVERASIELARMHVHLRPDTLVLLPGQESTVVVTVGETPVPDAPVWVDGRRVGRTGPEGRTRVALPVENAVRIRSVGPVLSRTVRVSSLFANLVGLVVVALAPVAGAAVVVWRRGPTRDEAVDSLRSAADTARTWLSSVARRVVAVVVSGFILSGRMLYDVGRRAVRTVRRAREVAVPVAVRVASVSYPSLALGVVRAGARPLLWLWSVLAPGAPGTGPYDSPRGPDDVCPGDGHGRDGRSVDGGSPLVSVRAAWGAFVRSLPVRRPETMTPGEIRRRAVELGFPERPVSRLTELFRAVEYGGREPTERRRKRATEAFERVSDSRGDSSPRPVEDSSTDGPDGGRDRTGNARPERDDP